MERVRITDVGPRDGLQSEAGVISAARKVEVVRAVMASGVDEVEVSSFVSPKWVPQLADAAEVFAQVAGEKPAGVALSALVPNERGMAAALAVNERAAPAGGAAGRGGKLIDKVAVFTAASETFCRRNINASIAESVARFKPVVRLAHENGMRVRGYVSCAIACPFEGAIEPGKVAQVAQLLLDIGCDEIDLGDTIGAAEPATINAMLNEVLNRLGNSREALLTLHLHDTFGAAVECVVEALQMGVRSFDGAAGGLGGCPYASTGGRRAPGNIATGALVEAVEVAGYSTGVDREALGRAEALAREIVAEAQGGAAGPVSGKDAS
jgi:hydroxymethylglutaryl-CoA lyase